MSTRQGPPAKDRETIDFSPRDQDKVTVVGSGAHLVYAAHAPISLIGDGFPPKVHAALWRAAKQVCSISVQ